MKHTPNQWQRTAAVTLAALILAATTVPMANGQGTTDPNRFSASARFLFNVSAKFQHLATPANPGPGVDEPFGDHIYDNGYVLRDDSFDPATGQNAGNKTWNWGFYDQASVVDSALELQTLRSPADGLTQTKSDDPQYGFEISYGRVLKTFDAGATPVNLGVMGAFGMTFLDIKNNSTINGMTTGVRDTYDLSALPIIPNAPYYGGAPVVGGPLPLLLPDSPTGRTPISMPATATERMKVDGQLYGFKVGPFVEWPMGDSISMQLQGGFAALLVDSDFTWSETISTGGAGAGSASGDEWNYGGFVEGQLTVRLSDHWSIFAAGGWQSIGSSSLRAGAKAVKLELDNVFSASGGVTFVF